MVHVGIEPLLENISGDLRAVVLWSIVARFLLALGFVLRCRRLYACTCAFCVLGGMQKSSAILSDCGPLQHPLGGSSMQHEVHSTLHTIRGTQYKQCYLESSQTISWTDCLAARSCGHQLDL